MASAALWQKDDESTEIQPHRRPRRRSIPFLVIGLIALAGISVVFLYGIKGSPDVLRDETTYWIVSHNVATHATVSLYGRPFFLHPPLLFLVEGGILRVFGGPDSFLYGTLDIRWLSALAGIATACFILLLSARAVGKLAALFALILYGLDPLVLRTVRRDMLEAPAMLATIGAVYLLTKSDDHGLRWPALAGLVIGLSLLTKEYTGFLLALVVVQWAWPHLSRHWVRTPLGGLTTKQAATALGVAFALYALYPLGWLIGGDGTIFIEGKLSLLQRFLGLIHDTGLNRETSHLTFVSALLLNLHQYAPSYILLAVGGVSALVLLFTSKRRSTSIVALWALVVTAWTGYETIKGLAEEGFYYYDIIPAAITTGALLAELTYRAQPVIARYSPWTKGLVPLLALTGLVCLAGYNTYVWARFYASPDNAVVQMRRYVDRHLPQRAAVIAGAEMDGPMFANQAFRFARLPNVTRSTLYQYKVLQPADVRRLARSGARYVIMSTKDVYVGYGLISPGASRYIHSHGTVIYSSYSTTYWHLQLIRLDTSLVSGGGPLRQPAED